MFRTIAYTTKEKLLLVQLIKDNAIVESKKTDSGTLMEKKKAWKVITLTYNSHSAVDTHRTSDQLRKLWNNLKQRKRRETIALHHRMMSTVGSSTKKPSLDPLPQSVENAVPNMDVVFENEQAKAIRTLEMDGKMFSSSNHENGKTEQALRVENILLARAEQEELHSLRKKMVTVELEKAIVDLARARDEAEISSLKLKKLKASLGSKNDEDAMSSKHLEERGHERRCTEDTHTVESTDKLTDEAFQISHVIEEVETSRMNAVVGICSIKTESEQDLEMGDQVSLHGSNLAKNVEIPSDQQCELQCSSEFLIENVKMENDDDIFDFRNDMERMRLEYEDKLDEQRKRIIALEKQLKTEKMNKLSL